MFGVSGAISRNVAAAVLLAVASIWGCAIEATSSQPSRRAPREEPVAKSPGKVDPRDAERLRRIMTPLLRAMDRPCEMNETKVALIEEDEINAANAGNCQFLVTMGLLRKANDEQLRGVLAHEVAHEDKGHVARAQVLGVGLNIGAAILEQIFPPAGAIAPVAGTLIARGYSRREEYDADRHGVEILRRAGYPKETLINALSWVGRAAGAGGGGGFLSTHPDLDDRISELKKLR